MAQHCLDMFCFNLNKDGNIDRVIAQEYMGVFSPIYSWVGFVVGRGRYIIHYWNVIIGDCVEG